MRLIHTTRLEFVEFFDSRVPRYSILSHCWGDDEVSYQDFIAGVDHDAARFKKIVDCCNIAQSQGFEWRWIDTYCIDKRSSAELSEAINSMFAWYKRSAVCYAFLSDLVGQQDNVLQSVEDMRVVSNELTAVAAAVTPEKRDLSSCRWFTRGWTLQELIAPTGVIFYDGNLDRISTRESLADDIATVTGIERDYLLKNQSIYDSSIAQRMSWASARTTTRSEDLAYCLLGTYLKGLGLLFV